MTANGTEMEVRGVGSSVIFPIVKKGYGHEFQNVHYVPEISTNLLSNRKSIEDVLVTKNKYHLVGKVKTDMKLWTKSYLKHDSSNVPEPLRIKTQHCCKHQHSIIVRLSQKTAQLIRHKDIS